MASAASFFQSGMDIPPALDRIIVALETQRVAAQVKEGAVIRTVGIMARVTLTALNGIVDMLTRFPVVALVAKDRQSLPGNKPPFPDMGVVAGGAALFQGAVGELHSRSWIVVALQAQFIPIGQETVRTVRGKIVTVGAVILHRGMKSSRDVPLGRFLPRPDKGYVVSAPVDLDNIDPAPEEQRLAEGPVFVHSRDDPSPVKGYTRQMVSIRDHAEDGYGCQVHRGLVGRVDDPAVSISPNLAGSDTCQQGRYTEDGCGNSCRDTYSESP